MTNFHTIPQMKHLTIVIATRQQKRRLNWYGQGQLTDILHVCVSSNTLSWTDIFKTMCAQVIHVYNRIVLFIVWPSFRECKIICHVSPSSFSHNICICEFCQTLQMLDFPNVRLRRSSEIWEKFTLTVTLYRSNCSLIEGKTKNMVPVVLVRPRTSIWKESNEWYVTQMTLQSVSKTMDK